MTSPIPILEMGTPSATVSPSAAPGNATVLIGQAPGCIVFGNSGLGVRRIDRYCLIGVPPPIVTLPVVVSVRADTLRAATTFAAFTVPAAVTLLLEATLPFAVILPVTPTAPAITLPALTWPAADTLLASTLPVVDRLAAVTSPVTIWFPLKLFPTSVRA